MMCANCKQKVSINTNYYEICEMYKGEIEGSVLLCSHVCIEEWLQ